MMQEMVLFYPQGHEAHFDHGHPERPERVEQLRQTLQQAGWWDIFPHLAPAELQQDLLASVHDPGYLNRLRMVSQQGARLDMDTYTTTASWELALNAAGGAVAVARAIWQGQARRGLALTRPPGHHATIRRGMGFCLLNNIALAAEDLISSSLEDDHSLSEGDRQTSAERSRNTPAAQRLAIIDLDLHHGNGTQDIFWQRADVLYISTHQSPLYPGTGHLGDIGAGPGEGYTANFPLPPATGDQGFLAVMDELILPLLDRFSPQMLLVSFGFDPHWRDPLGNLMLSAAGYGALIARLAAWADENCAGKLALFLEGGYDLQAGAACIQAAVAALLGQEWDDPLGPAPGRESLAWQGIVERAKQVFKV